MAVTKKHVGLSFDSWQRAEGRSNLPRKLIFKTRVLRLCSVNNGGKAQGENPVISIARTRSTETLVFVSD